ncbi:MAG TPA: hypothetical protein IAA06_13830, partial [Candidatus Blautia faecavium]|nr:hypothetical protein [Candidatus Blautia faecavium]
YIVSSTQDGVKKLKEAAGEDTEFVMYFPEAHILPAVQAMTQDSPLTVGCQSVYLDDVAAGHNFGAFTANRTAKAMNRRTGLCRLAYFSHPLRFFCITDGRTGKLGRVVE